MTEPLSLSRDSLSPLAERIWKALDVRDEATEQELIVACRPAHPDAVRRAIDELERADLIVKDDPDA